MEQCLCILLQSILKGLFDFRAIAQETDEDYSVCVPAMPYSTVQAKRALLLLCCDDNVVDERDSLEALFERLLAAQCCSEAVLLGCVLWRHLPSVGRSLDAELVSGLCFHNPYLLSCAILHSTVVGLFELSGGGGWTCCSGRGGFGVVFLVCTLL